jgi:type I restriction enzyme S subunit
MPGEVPGGWTFRPIDEVATVLLSNVDKKSVVGEPPVRLCNYMDVYTNGTITDRLDFMRATATAEQIAKFGLRKGDVMITKDSEDPTDIGIPSVVVHDFGEPVLCGYHLALLRPKHVDGHYLAWALRSRPVNEQFVRRANGSTRFGLTSGVISSARVPVPPLPEQKKIAAILSSVDEAIQATQAVIDQTRRVKEGLLQDLLTRGLPGHTRFKQTEIGEIPESWSVRKLRDVAQVVRGGSPRPAGDPRYFNGDHVPWITVAEVTKDRWVFLTGTTTSLTVEGREHSRYLESGTLVLTNSGATLGQPKILSIGGCANDGIAAFLNLHQCMDQLFVYYFLASQTNYLRDVVAPGLGQPNLNTTLIGDLSAPVPPLKEQALIAETMFASDVAIRSAEGTLDGYRAVKSGLLQDLLTGRVRVTP